MPDGPVLAVRLVGSGEAALRMEKRLRCAGRALGVTVAVDVEGAPWGEGGPEVWLAGRRIADRLVDTSTLERLLRPYVGRAGSGK